MRPFREMPYSWLASFTKASHLIGLKSSQVRQLQCLLEQRFVGIVKAHSLKERLSCRSIYTTEAPTLWLGLRDRCPQILTSHEEMDRFCSKYVSLFLLAEERGKHFGRVVKELSS